MTQEQNQMIANFKKIVRADPELQGCITFGPKMTHLPRQNFFWKKNNIIFMYLLAPFLVQNIKTTLRVNSEL